MLKNFVQRTPFQFKQFAVSHQQAAMPIGTDAVLLGAWAAHTHPHTILDIGTGCGIIALMLAQRYATATIRGIDIDEPSVTEAAGNFASSPFAQRLQALHSNFATYTPAQPFDLIVSNPPYFTTGPLPANAQRAAARHASALPYPQLAKGVAAMLAANGSFCCVLPGVAAAKAFGLEAEKYGLKANAMVEVQNQPGANTAVVLMRYSFTDAPLIISRLVLHTTNNTPTNEYKQLVKAFYLWA